MAFRLLLLFAWLLAVATVAHKVDHNSGLECAKQKVERSGPAPIVVQLE